MLRIQSAHGAMPAYPLKVGAHRKRHPLAMYFGVQFVAISIVAMATFATRFGALSPPVAPNFVARDGQCGGQHHAASAPIGSINKSFR